jgi:hypothetical protein
MSLFVNSYRQKPCLIACCALPGRARHCCYCNPDSGAHSLVTADPPQQCTPKKELLLYLVFIALPSSGALGPHSHKLRIVITPVPVLR